MIKKFFDYIEIKTKITSTFAFLMTMAYLFYIKSNINWELTLVFFASMLIFDLTTTAINNYIDTKTNQQVLVYSRKTAKNIIFIMMGISTALGLYIVYRTDIIVLIVGAICFLCGVFYTYGPVPISRQPLGEIFSGIFYGLFIPFIILYINLPTASMISLKIDKMVVSLDLFIAPLFTLILLSIAPICTTANIMLANNICDLEKDIAVKRHTLPYYIGHKAVYLFAALNYAAYLGIILMVILKILSPICLLSLLTIFLVQKNINIFLEKQEKETTFICSIKNYVIIMGSITLVIFISGLI